MLSLISNIPNLDRLPLYYVLDDLKIEQKPGTMWLEFGVAHGNTINFIAEHTTGKVYGFDHFHGLPEKWRDGFDIGLFSLGGMRPPVNSNVKLVIGKFQDTVVNFIAKHPNEKVSFIHINCVLYSSTKYALESVKNILEKDCIIVFNELLNYPGCFGDTGELKALYEFITENNVKYSWIGMNGTLGMTGWPYEKAAIIIHSVGNN